LWRNCAFIAFCALCANAQNAQIRRFWLILRKVRKMCILHNLATHHLHYPSFTALTIFGPIEVLETPKSTKMSQNEPKSTILRIFAKCAKCGTRVLWPHITHFFVSKPRQKGLESHTQCLGRVYGPPNPQNLDFQPKIYKYLDIYSQNAHSVERRRAM
jgi:hypothetical protein